jgi:hypothetical protein
MVVKPLEIVVFEHVQRGGALMIMADHDNLIFDARAQMGVFRHSYQLLYTVPILKPGREIEAFNHHLQDHNGII